MPQSCMILKLPQSSCKKHSPTAHILVYGCQRKFHWGWSLILWNDKALKERRVKQVEAKNKGCCFPEHFIVSLLEEKLQSNLSFCEMNTLMLHVTYQSLN